MQIYLLSTRSCLVSILYLSIVTKWYVRCDMHDQVQNLYSEWSLYAPFYNNILTHRYVNIYNTSDCSIKLAGWIDSITFITNIKYGILLLHQNMYTFMSLNRNKKHAQRTT